MKSFFQLDLNGFSIIEDFLTENEVKLLKQEGDNLVKNMPDQEKRVVFSTIDSESQQVLISLFTYELFEI